MTGFMIMLVGLGLLLDTLVRWFNDDPTRLWIFDWLPPRFPGAALMSLVLILGGYCAARVQNQPQNTVTATYGRHAGRQAGRQAGNAD